MEAVTLSAAAIEAVEGMQEETIALLKTLCAIPAPSHREERRAAFVRDWFVSNGMQAEIDEALNVRCPMGLEAHEDIVVVMAHTDTVFPDLEPMPMREESGRLYCPGVGDDTANLAALMMLARWLRDKKPRCGVLFVANSCEEGLGNLKGSRQIMKDFEGRVTELISLDGGLDSVVNNAVGSHRMKVTITAQGGHSYGAFGNTNAIVQMAEMIGRLYEKQVPTKAKTTYNVGVIEGGTTVNSICAQCSMLYEYRSEDRACLAEMEDYFDGVVREFREKGVNVDVEVLGVRPCTGDVDASQLEALTRRMAGILHEYTGNEIGTEAASTDANSALAVGVPAVTIGAALGHGAHTRGEWVDLSMMAVGQKIALATVLQYFA